MADRLAVHAVAGHGLVGVAHGQDPGLERHVVARHAGGVAAPVGALVVGQHPLADVGQPRAAQDPGADLGVLLHGVVLGVGQRAGLLEDRVGHADLADVVQHAGHPDAVGVVAREAQLAGHHLAVAAHGLGVAGGALVAHVQRLGQVEHRGQLGLVARCASRRRRRPGSRPPRRCAARCGRGPGPWPRTGRSRRRTCMPSLSRACTRVGDHAEAHGQRDRLVGEHLGDAHAQPLGHQEGLVLVGVGQDHARTPRRRSGRPRPRAGGRPRASGRCARSAASPASLPSRML